MYGMLSVDTISTDRKVMVSSQSFDNGPIRFERASADTYAVNFCTTRNAMDGETLFQSKWVVESIGTIPERETKETHDEVMIRFSR